MARALTRPLGAGAKTTPKVVAAIDLGLILECAAVFFQTIRAAIESPSPVPALLGREKRDRRDAFRLRGIFRCLWSLTSRMTTSREWSPQPRIVEARAQSYGTVPADAVGGIFERD